MNLHTKISLALVGVVAVFALGSNFALSRALISAFSDLQKRVLPPTLMCCLEKPIQMAQLADRIREVASA